MAHHDRSPDSYIIRSVQRFVADGEGAKLSKLLVSKRQVVNPRHLDEPLLDACRLRRETCVAPLLTAGADPNAADPAGRTPMHLLLEKGGAAPEVLKQLLRAGANPNKATYQSGHTAMHVACQKGLQVCVRLLLGSPVNFNKGDAHGSTPMLLAATAGHFTVVRMLLLEGADPNKANDKGETPLHAVCRRGDHDTVVDLLTCNANASVKKSRGQTPLLIAAQGGHLGIIQTLMEHGSDLHIQDTETGRGPLHWAVCNDNIKLATMLIRSGVDLNAKDKNWQTPFMLALTMGKTATVELLLRAGCDITATDKTRNTCLHLAARDGRQELIVRLVKAGLDVDVKGAGGASALMLAAYGGHPAVVHTLLRLGADPDLGDRNGATALVYTIFSNKQDHFVQGVAKELIRANCHLDKKTQLLKFAKTLPVPDKFIQELEDRMYRPVEAALLRGKVLLFLMLLKAGCDVSRVQGEKLLLQTYLYDAGVSPRQRRLILRLLRMEQRRPKTLLELCRKPVRLRLGFFSLPQSISNLPISQQLKRFLDYQDLEQIESEADPGSSMLNSPGIGNLSSLPDSRPTWEASTAPETSSQDIKPHRRTKSSSQQRLNKTRSGQRILSEPTEILLGNTKGDIYRYSSRHEGHGDRSPVMNPDCVEADTSQLRRFLDDLPERTTTDSGSSRHSRSSDGSDSVMQGTPNGQLVESKYVDEKKKSEKLGLWSLSRLEAPLDNQVALEGNTDLQKSSIDQHPTSIKHQELNNNEYQFKKDLGTDLRVEIGPDLQEESASPKHLDDNLHGASTAKNHNVQLSSSARPDGGAGGSREPGKHHVTFRQPSRIPRMSPGPRQPLSPTSTQSSHSSLSWSSEEDPRENGRRAVTPTSAYFRRSTPLRRTFHTTRDLQEGTGRLQRPTKQAHTSPM